MRHKDIGSRRSRTVKEGHVVTDTGSQQAVACLAQGRAAISFEVIWLVDAILKWLPGFRASYMGTIMGQAQGQPGWLKPWFNLWINLQHPRAMFFAYVVAVIDTLIAAAVIAGFACKVSYSAAIVFSLLIWGTGAELLCRPRPLQRGLLPGEEDQLVVAGRRTPAPTSSRRRASGRSGGSASSFCPGPGLAHTRRGG